MNVTGTVTCNIFHGVILRVIIIAKSMIFFAHGYLCYKIKVYLHVGWWEKKLCLDHDCYCVAFM